MITLHVALGTLAVAFASSSYSGAVTQLLKPSASERGLAIGLLAAPPSLGPDIDPIAGERWIVFEGHRGLEIGSWSKGNFYRSSIDYWTADDPKDIHSRRRARGMSKVSGMVHKSKIKILTARNLRDRWLRAPGSALQRARSLSQQDRGGSPGIGGLGVIGVALGMVTGSCFSDIEGEEQEAETQHSWNAPPEAWLSPAVVCNIALLIGVFWFAWTTYRSRRRAVSLIGTATFGSGIASAFLSSTSPLIDTCVIYAASLLAADSVLRSLVGAVFLLLSTCKNSPTPFSRYRASTTCLALLSSVTRFQCSSASRASVIDWRVKTPPKLANVLAPSRIAGAEKQGQDGGEPGRSTEGNTTPRLA
ncbi:unnamed protein product [Diplocarpon coronariae]